MSVNFSLDFAEQSGRKRPVIVGEANDGTPSVGTSRLRLTRRGRFVFGSLATLVIAALFALVAVFGATHAAASNESGVTEFGYVVVQPGDSLWSVATALDPVSDPRDVVAEIVSLNQLEGSGVQAGQPIAVPLRYSEVSGVVSASELGIDA